MFQGRLPKITFINEPISGLGISEAGIC